MKFGGGFDPCYNAQAGVNHDSRLIVGQTLSNSPNDKKERITTIDSIPEEIGKPKKGCADTGYLSETNIDKCTARGVDPFMATGRESHHSFLEDRLRNDANEVGDEN